jgi:unsaturated rhamnogalacturonyl hydrolase
MAIASGSTLALFAQPATPPSVGLALHRLPPEYPTPYGSQSIEQIAATLERVHRFLDATTPYRVVDEATGESVVNLTQPISQARPERALFSLVGYEWGVTYSGMMLAAEATGDSRYAEYVARRMSFIREAAPFFQRQGEAAGQNRYPFRSVIRPASLDDSGSIAAAMIKAQRAGLVDGLVPMIDNFLRFIAEKEIRLSDGTLARNRPLPNTLWLDDLYMSVPALAQMGALTGEGRYFDDAVRQVEQFAARMFNTREGLYMHGWVEGMDPHPEFRWARANGWALMAKVELLETLPESHPGHAAVLALFRAHAKGLAARQHGTGYWHQLLDRNDSYLETSATAIYAYCLARGINRGWLDGLAYAPAATLAWNAVSKKVNSEGQIEDVCVGTGMGFDPAFYYYRPVNVYAAHGYGPALLAGAEMILLLRNGQVRIDDSAMMWRPAAE